jgi:hypothetical protein
VVTVIANFKSPGNDRQRIDSHQFGAKGFLMGYFLFLLRVMMEAEPIHLIKFLLLRLLRA